jgi:glucokinase
VHAALAAKFPVHVVTNESLGLLGALTVAARS